MCLNRFERLIDHGSTTNVPKYVERGTILLVDREPYIVAQVSMNKYSLIGLDHGNRWAGSVKGKSVELCGISLKKLLKGDLDDYDIKILDEPGGC